MGFIKRILNLKQVLDFRDFVKEKIIEPIQNIGTEFRKMVMEKIIAVWNLLPPWLRKFITGTADKIKTLTIEVVENVKEAGSNILGGGDWAKDRIIQDYINAINRNHNIKIRNQERRKVF